MKTKGLTLLELLIAVSIFSLVALSLYAAFQSGIRTYERMDSSFDVYQALRVVMNRLELDLKNSFSYLRGDSKFIGSEKALAFFSAIDTLQQDNETYPNIGYIKYEFTDNMLRRTCYLGLDALTEGSEPSGEKVFSLLKDISFTYAVASKDLGSVYQWQEEWPKSEDLEKGKKFPLAVKVSVSLAEKDKRQKEIGTVEISRIIPLALGE